MMECETQNATFYSSYLFKVDCEEGFMLIQISKVFSLELNGVVSRNMHVSSDRLEP
jgi:hypothetical protein